MKKLLLLLPLALFAQETLRSSKQGAASCVQVSLSVSDGAITAWVDDTAPVLPIPASGCVAPLIRAMKGRSGWVAFYDPAKLPVVGRGVVTPSMVQIMVAGQ